MWNKTFQALLQFKSCIVGLVLSFGSVPLFLFNYLPCQSFNSCVVADELCFFCSSVSVKIFQRICAKGAGRQTLSLPLSEVLGHRNLLVIFASCTDWVIGMLPDCCFCSEVSQLELNQDNLCSSWGALQLAWNLSLWECSAKSAQLMAPWVAVLSHPSEYWAEIWEYYGRTGVIALTEGGIFLKLFQ